MLSEYARLLRASIVAVTALALLLPATGATAEGEQALPDPATILIPDIATKDPRALSHGYEFFVFHSSSVDYATAYADLAECRTFLPPGVGRTLPAFTPFRAPQAAPAREFSVYQPYGPAGVPGIAGAVVTGIIASMVMPGVIRGQENTILRRCMEPRGYVRYAVPEPVWRALNDPKGPSIVAMQAKIASGPRPPQAMVVD